MAVRLPLKIPTYIAGFRVPRRIRKGPIGAFLASSGGQVIVAELLLALGGALISAALKNGRQRDRAIPNDVKTRRAMDDGAGRRRRVGLLAAAMTVVAGRALDAVMASIAGPAKRRQAAPAVAKTEQPVET